MHARKWSAWMMIASVSLLLSILINVQTASQTDDPGPPPENRFCNEQAKSEFPREIPIEPGLHFLALDFDEFVRCYALYIPDSLVLDTPAKLLIELHGWGGQIDKTIARNNMRLKDLADNEGWIIAYAQGEMAYGHQGWSTGWNVGFAFDEFVGFDDVLFIGRLINQISASLNIDADMIVVLGESLGGMMAHRLGAELSDRLAALAVYGGTFGYQETPTSEWLTIPEPQGGPLSVGIFHGALDEFVPFEGGCDTVDVMPPGCWKPVREAVELWADHNLCPQEPEIQDRTSRNGIRVEYHRPCAAGTEVTLYLQQFRGHLNWWDLAAEVLREYLERISSEPVAH